MRDSFRIRAGGMFFFLVVVFVLPGLCKNIYGTLPCRVLDKRTQSPVPKVTICIQELSACATTDTNGNALFDSVAPRMYSLYAGAAGYDTVMIPTIAINSGINNLLTVSIEKSAAIQELDRLVVRGKKTTQKTSAQITSVARLDNYELSNTAGTANDINRVLETIPSVVGKGADFDNALYVRGGHSRENIYVIDNMEIENISHFSDVSGSGGAFGYINGALVDQLDFYAGGIPSSYPPRISSVIDIRIRDGSLLGRKQEIDLNMSGLGLIIEGPFPKKSGAYLLGIRFADLHLLKPFLTQTGIPRFGDSQSKFTFFLGKKNTLSLTNLFGFDTYSEKADASGWGFPTDWTEKLYQFATGLNFQTSLTALRNLFHVSFCLRNEESFEEVSAFSGPQTLYEFSSKFNMQSPFDTIITVHDTTLIYRNEIAEKEIFGRADKRNHISLRDDISFFVRESDLLQAGINAKREILNLANRDGRRETWSIQWHPDTTDTSVKKDTVLGQTHQFDLDSSVASEQAGGYCQYILKQGMVKTIAGVRADYFRLVRDYGISPRIGASMTIDPAGTFSLSCGLLYQLPSDLSGKLADLIVPNPNFPYRPFFWELELQRNWQAVFSYERQFPQSHVLTFESYYKWYDREYPLVNPDTYLYEKQLSEALLNNTPFTFPKPRGKKKAYGMELSFQKKQQKGLFYAAGYSLFSVKNQYADGRWYNDIKNARNSLAFTLGVTFLKSHTLSLRLAAAEGRPYSKAIPDSFGIMQYDTTAGYYTERLDPTCSVNLRYSFRFFRHWGNITGYVEIWNVLNYSPVVERYKGYTSYRDFAGNGLIPLAGITIDF